MIASDLDGTVIFSPRGAAATGSSLAGLLEVDVYKGQPCGYMTTVGAARWAELAATGSLVPVTTRSVEQYLRLRLPGPAPRLAVVANGAQLLVDGVPDPGWERDMRARVAAAECTPFAEVWPVVEAWGDHDAVQDARAVADHFTYLRVYRDRPEFPALLAEIRQTATGWGWSVTLQGRKLYIVPRSLDKAVAATAVAERAGAARFVAGGDSLLDADMLRAAHAAIRPAHGELHAVGWSSVNCVTTAAAGPLAGDEILDWYAAQLS